MNVKGSSEPCSREASAPATTLDAYRDESLPSPGGFLETAAPSEIPAQFGRYRILKRLGQGGMGAVYLAHDTQLQRAIALKIPRFLASDRPESRERFYREARAAATLNHPHLCPVHDVGEANGVPYLTMAFIEGRPLTDYVQRGRMLPERQGASLVRKLALALAEAHAKGIVHRDLKPANIMINQRKEPVVMDFGLACLTEQADSRLTQTGTILGTPSYMAPEQVNGDPAAIGPACDIYSLGVILYELLTSRVPFQGSVAAVLGQIVALAPPPPSKHRPDLDPRMEAICLKAMAKHPSDRFASMQEFAAALESFLRDTAPAAGTPAAKNPENSTLTAVVPPPPTFTGESLVLDVSETVGPAPQADYTTIPIFTAPKPVRRRPVPWWPFAALAGAALLALVAGVVFKLQTKNGAVVLEVNEPGAEVSVDDQQRVTVTGADHEPIRIEVAEGRHELTVTKGGFVSQTRNFLVKRGEAIALQVRLEPTPPVVQPPAANPQPERPQHEKPNAEKPQIRQPPANDATAQPPPAAPQRPAPAPRNAARQGAEPLPRDRWISLDEFTPETSWVWRNNSRTTDQKIWRNGVLTLENRGYAFNGIRARDLSFRAQVRFIEGNNLALIVRDKQGRGGIYSMVQKVDERTVGIAVLHKVNHKMFNPEGDFFELRVTAVGDQITVQANGATLIQYTETELLEAGHISITAFDAVAQFKELEVRILDP